MANKRSPFVGTNPYIEKLKIAKGKGRSELPKAVTEAPAKPAAKRYAIWGITKSGEPGMAPLVHNISADEARSRLQYLNSDPNARYIAAPHGQQNQMTQKVKAVADMVKRSSAGPQGRNAPRALAKTAGVTTKAAGATSVAGKATKALKAGKTVARGLGKLALPIGIGLAAAEAYQAYKKNGAKGAAFAAVDSMLMGIPSAAAADLKHKTASGGRNAPKRRVAKPKVENQKRRRARKTSMKTGKINSVKVSKAASAKRVSSGLVKGHYATSAKSGKSYYVKQHFRTYN